MSESKTKVVELLENDVVVTMYGAHKILADAGVSVRPQMLYTYGKKGYIATVDGDGKRTTVRTINEWRDTYVANKIAKSNKIKDELAGK
jgi:hypothetical protein